MNQHYELQQLLQQLQLSLLQPRSATQIISTETISTEQLQTEIAQIKNLSQQINAAAPTETHLQIQSIQTEINKQLRLLETDLIFLKAARQPDTMQQRQQQIQTRVTLLLSYVTRVLEV
jgi:hypothetical protein